MDEYISRNELLKAIQSNVAEAHNERCVQLLEAILNAPTADVVPKSEVEKLNAEIERLHGILLQFTDIVHKWGAKNNIDTSEISLVPILQEEADSIIKKANQELAREIFEEIEEALLNNHCLDEWSDYPTPHYYDELKDDIAELKKKYTGEK